MARPALVAVALILLFSLASAARREPGFAADPSAQKAQVADAENMGVDEGCEGVTEDECLLRRTLTAHTDYIYTNKNDKP